MTRFGGEQLSLVTRNGRVKHHLAGRPLHGGDPVDLCFSGGWVTGRYEWSGETSEPPRFHYSLELAGEGRVAEGSFDLPEGALLRWPGSA